MALGDVVFVIKLGARFMSQRQIGIADMQCWVFRKAQEKWNLSPIECANVFARNNLLAYIADCYDVLHVSSYQCALEDIEELLSKRGYVK